MRWLCLLGLHDSHFCFNHPLPGTTRPAWALWACKHCGFARWHRYLWLHRKECRDIAVAERITARSRQWMTRMKARGRL